MFSIRGIKIYAFLNAKKEKNRVMEKLLKSFYFP